MYTKKVKELSLLSEVNHDGIVTIAGYRLESEVTDTDKFIIEMLLNMDDKTCKASVISDKVVDGKNMTTTMFYASHSPLILDSQELCYYAIS